MQCADGFEQLASVAPKHDAEIFQILRGELGQCLPIDLIVAESGLVSLEPKLPQPVRDIHRRHAAW